MVWRPRSRRTPSLLSVVVPAYDVAASGSGSMKMSRWSKAATRRVCSEQSMPLPKTSPDMSPMPTAVKSSVWQSMPRSRKWRCTETHAPRAVMPIALWS